MNLTEKDGKTISTLSGILVVKLNVDLRYV